MTPLEEDYVAIIPKAFGKVMRALRIEKGLTQEAFGAMLGLHRTHIGMIERAERDPKLSTVFQIAEKLDIPLPQLMNLLVDEVKGQRLS